MMLENKLNQYSSYVRSFGPATYKPVTGFSENWLTAMHMGFYEGMSTSRDRVFLEHSKERNDKLWGMVVDGTIPDKQARGFLTGGIGREGMNFNLLSIHAKNNLGLDVETDEEIMEKIRTELKHYRNYSEDVYDRASMGGVVGQFAGAANTDMLDPILFPGFLVGGYSEGAVALNYMTRALYTGLKVGGIEAGLELARQVPVTSWKQDVGADYSALDALESIAMVAGVAGGIGAGGEVIAHGVRRFLKRLKPETKTWDAALEQINTLMREQEEGSKIAKTGGEIATGVEREIKRQNDLPRAVSSELKGEVLTPPTPKETRLELPSMRNAKEIDRIKFAFLVGKEQIDEIRKLAADAEVRAKGLRLLKKFDEQQEVLLEHQLYREILELHDRSTPAAAKKMAKYEAQFIDADQMSKITPLEEGKAKGALGPIDTSKVEDDVVEAAFSKLDENAEIPVEVTQEGQAIDKSVKAILEEEDANVSIVNAIKECLVSRKND